MTKRAGMLLALFLLSASSSVALSVGPEIPLSVPDIEPATFLRGSPDVASNGAGFLVVWSEAPRGLQRIRATRVAEEGGVVDAESLVIGRGRFAAAASDGGDYVVAHDCEGASVCLARVDSATGAVTSGARIDNASAPAIASNGRGYLLAFRRAGRIEGVPVTADAVVAGEPFFIIRSPGTAGIASNGAAYFVVADSGAWELNGVLVSDRAVIGERQTLAVVEQRPAARDWAVASDGEGFLVVWTDATALRASSVTAAGVAGPARTLHAEAVRDPSVTWIGAEHLVTYSDRPTDPVNPDTSGDLWGIRVSPAGDAGAPQAIASGPGGELASDGATGGAATLLVWRKGYRPDAAQIEGRLLDHEGGPRVLSTDPQQQQWMAAARIHSRTVFVWQENAGAQQIQRVMLQRIGAAGLPLDGRGIPLRESAMHQRRPALAGSLVAWLEEPPLVFRDTTAVVWARMLDASGVPYGDAFVVARARYGSSLAVAAAGTAHLVVWESPDDGIRAARIDPFASLVTGPVVVSSNRHDHGIAAASDGSAFLVTWLRHERPSGVGCVVGCVLPRSVQAAMVTRWGVVGGPPVELAPAEYRYEQRVVWNGAHYAVFWTGENSSAVMRTVRRSGLPTGDVRIVAERSLVRSTHWTGTEYRLVLLSGEENAIVRYDPDLRRIEAAPLRSDERWDSPIVLTDAFVAYATFSSRVVARPLD